MADNDLFHDHVPPNAPAVPGNPTDTDAFVASIVAGAGVTVDATDPANPIVKLVAPTVAPTTVAGTNGVLSSALTWVKSTDATVVAQLVELLANSDSAVLASAYVSPGSQAITLSTTAVAQKARVTALNAGGGTASALSSTITPTAT